MSRPLKLKVTGTVLCSVFQLPDHGFIGQFAGAYRRRFFPERVGWPSLIHTVVHASAAFIDATDILFGYAVMRTAARVGHEW